MATPTKSEELFQQLISKGSLKQTVYSNTLATFNHFKKTIKKMAADYGQVEQNEAVNIPFEFKDKGTFQIELKFAGDILLFMMHTNVFEFPRTHEVMKTPYVKEDKERSYCGIINIYNFLADSFKYNRVNDIGYLIGRIFINKDRHYYIEGKREIGLLFNNFSGAEIKEETVSNIIESAILYTINFDLLTPPYAKVKEVSVQEIKAELSNLRIKTGKRLGFKFQADIGEEQG